MFSWRFSHSVQYAILLLSFLLMANLTIFGTGSLSGAMDSGSTAGAEKIKMAVILCVASPSDERAAVMLIKSIREFGGGLKDAPVYVFQNNKEENPCYELKKMTGVNILLLEIDPAAKDYLFSAKVYACAQAEKMLAGNVENLVWFDNQCFILAPLDDLVLREGKGVAMRPVQLLNKVGLPPDAPIDEFWERIYKETNVDPGKVPVIEAFADGNKIRFYINCQIISFRPETGICREWERIFTSLVKDAEYQKQACPDTLHQIFLHQAVLSAVINARIKESELQWLSAACGYPLNLHEKLPNEKKLLKLNDAKYLICDTILQRPDWMEIMPIEEPLRSWMEKTYFESLKVSDNIYREETLCNSYLIKTKDGNVMIDPGGASAPASWLQKLNKQNPVKAILLTHGHEDHRTGITVWKGGRDIPVIAQRNYADVVRYQDRIARFNELRVARQRGKEIPADFPEQTKTPIDPNVFFDKSYTYELGGLHFEMMHFGGETPDQSIIWMPEEKALCIADDFYSSFPNLYTLRGTPPRPALEYAAAVDKAISLEPEYLLPGHGEPVIGRERIKKMLTIYRDAILYVHNETVKGMNAGKDVFTLMREIKLPPELKLDEAYGRVSWSVRGIYEGYIGWFDGNISNMYDQPVSAVYSDLLELAGGAAPILKRAKEDAEKGDDVKVLRLTEIILLNQPDNKAALELRLSSVLSLYHKSGNWIERNWLSAEYNDIKAKLAAKPQ
jgi:glyoxylase-like metal-dependent hydrolase (beta-lactamase superfamily II)